MQKVNLTEIADVQRANEKNIYPVGTIYIQISACRRSHLEQFKMLEAPQKLENKYAVIIPKIKINPRYLKIALERAAEEFMVRFVGDSINIQIDAFKNFELEIHNDLDTQDYITNFCKSMDNSIEMETQQIKKIGEMKKYFLGKMMV